MTNTKSHRYKIKHRTTYSYGAVVHQSYHVLRLQPRVVAHQEVREHRIHTQPAAQRWTEHVDFFGNPFRVLRVETDHSVLTVTSESDIVVTSQASPALEQSCDWRLLANDRAVLGNDRVAVEQYKAASRHARRIEAAAEFARPSFPEGRPVLAGAHDLMRRIFEEFSFDATATDVSTPIETVLKTRRGVCQDFAHLQIAAMRSLGLPARYVSGYILTHPPEGQERLQGADASHAWVAVWAPETGWVDFDPTNNMIPHGEHITIAYGRDYDDVSPISGVLLGGGAHSVDVAVDVVPVER